MLNVQIGNVKIAMSKNEAKDVKRLQDILRFDGKDQAQRHADIWMRSAPSGMAKDRRKAAVTALGLSDEVKFL